EAPGGGRQSGEWTPQGKAKRRRQIVRPLTRALAGLVLAAMMVLAGGTALAHHVDDGGIDMPWDQAMNHPDFWETEFVTPGHSIECKKYEGHGGFIPAGYDAAVIKDGQKVRVYQK